MKYLYIILIFLTGCATAPRSIVTPQVTAQTPDNRVKVCSAVSPIHPFNYSDALSGFNSDPRVFGGEAYPNNIYWTGQCVQGVASGKGVARWGSKYTLNDTKVEMLGTIKKGVVHGSGITLKTEDMKFQGVVDNGRLILGTLWTSSTTIDNFDRFEGTFRADGSIGTGIIHYKDGSFLAGNFYSQKGIILVKGKAIAKYKGKLYSVACENASEVGQCHNLNIPVDNNLVRDIFTAVGGLGVALALTPLALPLTATLAVPRIPGYVLILVFR